MPKTKSRKSKSKAPKSKQQKPSSFSKEEVEQLANAMFRTNDPAPAIDPPSTRNRSRSNKDLDYIRKEVFVDDNVARTRTTVHLSVDVLVRAQHMAIDKRQTFSALVEGALIGVLVKESY